MPVWVLLLLAVAHATAEQRYWVENGAVRTEIKQVGTAPGLLYRVVVLDPEWWHVSFEDDPSTYSQSVEMTDTGYTDLWSVSTGRVAFTRAAEGRVGVATNSTLWDTVACVEVNPTRQTWTAHPVGTDCDDANAHRSTMGGNVSTTLTSKYEVFGRPVNMDTYDVLARQEYAILSRTGVRVYPAYTSLHSSSWYATLFLANITLVSAALHRVLRQPHMQTHRWVGQLRVVFRCTMCMVLCVWIADTEHHSDSIFVNHPWVASELGAQTIFYCITTGMAMLIVTSFVVEHHSRLGHSRVALTTLLYIQLECVTMSVFQADGAVAHTAWNVFVIAVVYTHICKTWEVLAIRVRPPGMRERALYYWAISLALCSHGFMLMLTAAPLVHELLPVLGAEERPAWMTFTCVVGMVARGYQAVHDPLAGSSIKEVH